MGTNKIKILIILIFGTLSLISCQSKKMEEKFEWLATPSAPQEYPIEVYEGALIANDFTYSFDAIWGTQNTGWGNPGGTMSVSVNKIEVPSTLQFTWLSLVENKFYTGKWSLDKEKIKELFEKGFDDEDTHKKDTYNTFVIGLAPKGKVVLWIKGAGNQKEVGAFQAHDTIVSKKDAYENAQYMFEQNYAENRLKSDFVITSDIKESIANFGMPSAEIYELYRNKYNWKPMVELPEGSELIDFGFNNYNGEQENLLGTSVKNMIYQKRAVPKFAAFYWKDKDNNKYGVWADSFDEKEIFESFKKLGNVNNIDLIIKADPKNTKVQMSLKNKEMELPLNNVKIRLSDKIE